MVGAVVVGARARGRESPSSANEELSGCHGVASSTIPSSHEYVLTSFGNSPSDNGEMSCGEYTDDGNWYYAASRQRYGCGSHVQVEANGKCVVVETDDYGPDVCVEAAAGVPILDASPLVAEALFGVSSAGWSDGLHVVVTEVPASTPLGACATTAPVPPPPVADAGTGTKADARRRPAVDSGTKSGAIPCTSDGTCNPGNDGSGMICEGNVCVPGCHNDGQCPGITSCVGGTCQ